MSARALGQNGRPGVLSSQFDRRWLLPIAFVCLLNFWNPVGYVGGGADDDRYIAGALCWIANGPCLPVNHWEGRWPLVGMLALSIGTLGFNRVAVGLPSFLASVASVLLIKAIGDRLDRRIGTAAALILAAIPAFVAQVFTATVEPFELAFVLAGFFAIVSGRPILAGLAFAMAFQVRETSIAALLPALFLIRKDASSIVRLGVGFTSVLLVEFVIYYFWTGDPLYRRLLSVGHTYLPSSELGKIPGGPPFFNVELIQHWRPDAGIHVHWIVDGFLNLLLNLKGSFLYSAAPLFFLVYKDRLSGSEKHCVKFLIASAIFYSAVLIYVLAIDPKARMMFVPLAALALAFAIVAVRAWNPVMMATVASIGALIGMTMIAQPRQLRWQLAAERYESRYPGQIETSQPGYFTFSRLRDLPSIGSGKPYLLVLKSNRCSIASYEDPVDLRSVRTVAETRANPLAIAFGNRWSLCLFSYVGEPVKTPPRRLIGPWVRIRNDGVIGRNH